MATYGQVARLAGMPRHARQVGYALHRLPNDTRVPWHRVVNARGEISARAVPDDGRLQHLLLAEEGIEFAAGGRIPLSRYRWKPTTQGNR